MLIKLSSLKSKALAWFKSLLKIAFACTLIWWIFATGKIDLVGLKKLFSPGFIFVGLIFVFLSILSATERWRRILHFLITLVSVLFLLVLVWYGFDIAWRVRFQEIGGLEFLPMSIGYLALPVGSIFAILAAIANFLDPKHSELETQQ